MKYYFAFAFMLVQFSALAQYNFMFEKRGEIVRFYQKDTLYSLKVDTIGKHNIVLTFKSKKQYPFFTYEIDKTTNRCISVGMVSKNTEVFQAYVDLLNFSGTIVYKDSAKQEIIYRVQNHNAILYYTLRRPYFNDKNRNKRLVFYLMISSGFPMLNSELKK
jgi:hypothetical protein